MKPLSPQLLQKINETLQTTGNNANPKLMVLAARAKDTVRDSDYWIVETIRETSGLGDVSVAPRRFKANGRPNRLYGIHVHNGEVKTLIREYPDKLKQGWVEQFSLGVGSSVAMAFNGHWERYRKLWRLITDESPYISWVDNNNDLWVQLWNDETTRVKLSTNVSKVRMIRAWKNTVTNYLDQGIVAAYIKTDGKVYYRNYCIQEDSSEAWESEKVVGNFAGGVNSVNLFITNDYRMGFVIEDNLGQIHWMVTQRNWGGMASPAENLVTSIQDIMFEVTPIKYYESFSDIENIDTSITDIKFYVCPAGLNPTIVGTERLSFLDKKTLKLNFNYQLECDLVQLKNNLTIQNVVGQVFAIDVLSQSGNTLTITTTQEMPFTQDVIVKYTAIGSYYLAFRISNNCVYDYGNTIDFTIKGEPRIGYVIEQIATNITDITFGVTQVYYSSVNSGEENIETSITDIAFVVTKVGSSPL